jgi:hypothetical protein
MLLPVVKDFLEKRQRENKYNAVHVPLRETQNLTTSTEHHAPITQVFVEKESEERKYLAEDSAYTKKQYFMTPAEHHIFGQLQKIAGEKYHVFPQVHYSKIMYAEGQQNFHNPWFNKIDRKSADFVLFDKHDISPILVIEHDDKTHNRKDRIERDDFVDHALEKSGIPIVHVRPFASEDELTALITAKISI